MSVVMLNKRADIMPRKPKEGAEVYDCFIDGEMVAKGVGNPELSLARIFVARGWTGRFEVWGPSCKQPWRRFERREIIHRTTVNALLMAGMGDAEV